MVKKNIINHVLIAALTMLLVHNITSAQQWKVYRYEINAGVSSNNYFGDIGGATSANNWYGIKDIEVFSSRPSIYFGSWYYLNKRLAFCPSITYGLIHGSDENSYYEVRDYGFNTSLILTKVSLSYSIVKINDLFGKKKMKFLSYSKPMNKTFIIYVCLGGSYALYNVKPNEKLNTHNLNAGSINVATKGWSNAFALNAGIGIKYFFIRSLALSASIEYHSVSSDNLDGYKTFTNVNDIFYLTSVGLSYRLPTNIWGEIEFKKRKKPRKKGSVKPKDKFIF